MESISATFSLDLEMMLKASTESHLRLIEEFVRGLDGLVQELASLKSFPTCNFGIDDRNLVRIHLASAANYLGLLSVIRDVNEIKAGIMKQEQAWKLGEKMMNATMLELDLMDFLKVLKPYIAQHGEEMEEIDL